MRSLLLLATLVFLLPTTVFAEGEDLTALSLDELMDISVSAVHRRKETLRESAAAVTVLTAEEIRRSGVTSVPEALRLVPGVEVARINAHTWAITSRGFNDLYANKLLVLVDGISVYNPLYGGVFWDTQALLLEDVDRIEVIRGPAGVAWGANAVNGVINIIRTRAKDTKGGRVSVYGGNIEEGGAYARWGGASDDGWSYRGSVEGQSLDSFERQDGTSAGDGAVLGAAELRAEKQVSDLEDFEIVARGQRTDTGESFEQPVPVPPFSVTGRKDITNAEGSLHLRRNSASRDGATDTSLLLGFNHIERQIRLGEFRVSTLDLEYAGNISFSERSRLSAGIGGRTWYYDFENSEVLRADDASDLEYLAGVFGHYEYELLENELTVAVGSRLDSNAYSGLQLQPALSAVWTANPHLLLWTSVSRTVRLPTAATREAEIDLAFSPGPQGQIVATRVLSGNTHEEEEALTMQWGARSIITPEVSLDAAAFYSLYSDLTSVSPQEAIQSQELIVQPVRFENDIHGSTHGVELAVNWRPVRRVSLAASYSYLEMDLDLDKGGTSLFIDLDERRSPEHQVTVHGALDVTESIELDVLALYRDRLAEGDIDEYLRLDVRVGFELDEGVELSVAGQNLLEDRHDEFAESEVGGVEATQIPRSIFARLSFDF